MKVKVEEEEEDISLEELERRILAGGGAGAGDGGVGSTHVSALDFISAVQGSSHLLGGERALHLERMGCIVAEEFAMRRPDPPPFDIEAIDV